MRVRTVFFLRYTKLMPNQTKKKMREDSNNKPGNEKRRHYN